MGSVSSSIPKTFVTHIAPVAAIHPRFCSSRPRSLLVRQYEDAFTVRDVATDCVVFHTQIAADGTKLLLDADHRRVVRLCRERCSATFHANFTVRRGESNGSVLCEIAAAAVFRTQLDARFHNVLSGKTCQLGVSGDWLARAAMFWVDQGSGVREPAARVHPPVEIASQRPIGTQAYVVDIAPNVDAALVVLACAAMDASMHANLRILAKTNHPYQNTANQ